MISIVIPTCARPEMLGTALRSIANQTARNEIVEIIVSENGGDISSKEICAAFPELPITYIFREKPLSTLDHGFALFNADLKGEYTAMLHDDDWWAPIHLENALEALRADTMSAAYFCSYFIVAGESSHLSSYDNFFFWFGSGYPTMNSIWRLDRNAILLSCLLGTGGIYSSLVARTEASKMASKIYGENNPFDNDRMLAFALTEYGTIIYQPVPHVYYRRHSGQDTHNYGNKRQISQMKWTTEWLIRSAGISWESTGALFSKQCAICPQQSWQLLQMYAMSPWCLPLLVQHSNQDNDLARTYRTFALPIWKKILLQITPPFFVVMKAAFKRNLGKKRPKT